MCPTTRSSHSTNECAISGFMANSSGRKILNIGFIVVLSLFLQAKVVKKDDNKNLRSRCVPWVCETGVAGEIFQHEGGRDKYFALFL